MERSDMAKLRPGTRIFIFNSEKEKVESGRVSHAEHRNRVEVEVNGRSRFVPSSKLHLTYREAQSRLEQYQFERMVKKYGR